MVTAMTGRQRWCSSAGHARFGLTTWFVLCAFCFWPLFSVLALLALMNGWLQAIAPAATLGVAFAVVAVLMHRLFETATKNDDRRQQRRQFRLNMMNARKRLQPSDQDESSEEEDDVDEQEMRLITETQRDGGTAMLRVDTNENGGDDVMYAGSGSPLAVTARRTAGNSAGDFDV